MQARERPLRVAGPSREKAAASQEALNLRRGKPSLRGAERRNVRRCRLQCSVPCMPVVSKAGNRITWNHFSFWGRSPSPSPPTPTIARGAVPQPAGLICAATPNRSVCEAVTMTTCFTPLQRFAPFGAVWDLPPWRFRRWRWELAPIPPYQPDRCGDPQDAASRPSGITASSKPRCRRVGRQRISKNTSFSI